jgi:branched-chain amino acid transport system ATP-binding protein
MADALLKAEHLVKTLGGIWAVDDVTFDIKPRSITGLIGPNGAGKSTVLNLLSGLYAPTAGQIFFKGEDITGLPIAKRVRKGIGNIFQIVRLFPSLTIGEHILMAITRNLVKSKYRNDEIEKLNEILAKMGMSDKADTIVSTLSLSEQRKVDFGMLFALDSELLLLDEPFAGLGTDQISELEIMIQDLAERKAIFIIEHRMNILMGLASRVLVMARGKLFADGTPDEVKDDENVLKFYFGEGQGT